MINSIQAITLFLVTTLMSNVYAQPRQPHHSMKKQGDKLESVKIGMISKRLEITPEQAKKFWPLYSEWEKERESLRKKANHSKNEDDTSYEDKIKMRLEHEQKKLDLKKKYIKKMMSVLSPEQIYKLIKVKRTLGRMVSDRKSPWKFNRELESLINVILQEIEMD